MNLASICFLGPIISNSKIIVNNNIYTISKGNQKGETTALFTIDYDWIYHYTYDNTHIAF